MITIPLHVWLPAQPDPVLAGGLEIDGRAISFRYDKHYVEAGHPAISQELATRKLSHRSRHNLLFPMMQDAGPDSWGEMLLELKLQHLPTQIELLTQCQADGAGNLVLGELTPDRFATIEVSVFIDILRRYQDEAQSEPAYARFKQIVERAVDQGTGLGGAKPKLELVEGGVQYIAKFPDIHDDIYLPHVECAMLKLATLCGIQAASASVRAVGDHRHPYCLMSRRFDRVTLPGGVGRIGYASAHCVNQVEEARVLFQSKELDELTLKGYSELQLAKSYPRLAVNMQRWSANKGDYESDVRELWLRIVLNALIRNTDDHTKNHGLLCQNMAQQHWRLSPAFDLVCGLAGESQPVLCMPYLYERAVTYGRQPRRARMLVKANRQDLIKAAALHYHYQEAEAAVIFDHMQATVRQHWRALMRAEGMPDVALERYAVNLDQNIADSADEA